MASKIGNFQRRETRFFRFAAFCIQELNKQVVHLIEHEILHPVLVLVCFVAQKNEPEKIR